MLMMKNEKREKKTNKKTKTKGMEIANQESIKRLEEKESHF